MLWHLDAKLRIKIEIMANSLGNIEKTLYDFFLLLNVFTLLYVYKVR